MRRGILAQPKVLEMREYFVYFPFSELRGWVKRTAEARSFHCVVLPLVKYRVSIRQFGRIYKRELYFL